MTNNIIINDRNRTIEITKKFAAAAKRFGSAEYQELQEARKDFPKYRVQIKATGKKNACFKGLTFDYMESYIQKHDNEEMLKEFYTLCGKSESGEDQEFAAAATYGEIKKWFLDQHNDLNLKDQRNKIDAILNKNAA